MLKRSVLPRLDDMLQQIVGVQSIVASMSFESYQASFMERRAVERCIEIISEAVRHLPDEMTSRYPAIPWHDIRGIGNRLRHDYQRTDDEIIWRVATQSLNELRPVVEKFILEVVAAEAAELEDKGQENK